jgi:hypothetical protein
MKTKMLFPCLICFLVVLLVPALSTYGDELFSLHTFLWDSGPVSVADYDQDGHLDLTIGSRIYENQDGSFELAFDLGETGSNNRQLPLSWGDFDNDNDLDCAVENKIYRNTGSGFEFHLEMAEKGRIIWGDFDGDEDLDIAILNKNRDEPPYEWPDRLEVYENLAGSFVPYWSSPTIASGIMEVAWGDFDNDDDLDLVFGVLGPNIVYRNDGNGFVEFWNSGIPDDGYRVAWGNVYPLYGYDQDLVTASTTHIRVFRYLGLQGSDTFESSPYVDIFNDYTIGSAKEISLGDYDGDGYVDLAIVYGGIGSPYSKVYHNDGQYGGGLSLAWEETEGNYQSQGTAWGDFDGDGDLDLLISHGEGLTRIYENNQNRVFVNFPWYPQGYVNGEYGDFDSDGWEDLAVANYGGIGSPTCVYRNEEGGFSDMDPAAWCDPQNYHSSSVSWGDYDNDGDLDLAIGNTTDMMMNPEPTQIYQNTGGWLEWAFDIEADSSTDDVEWADYDGDGRLDLAAIQGGVRIYTYTGSSFVLSHEIPEGAEKIRWGDVDCDGDLDLFLIGQGGKIYAWNGSQFVLAYSLPNVGHVLDWGDFDLDCDLDLAAAGNHTPVEVFENTGTGFISRWHGSEALAAADVAWVDYNRDGLLDLAVEKSWPEHGLLLYRNRAGTFEEAYENPSLIGNVEMTWGDYDRDGDPDLVTDDAMNGHLYDNTSSSTQLFWDRSLPNNPTLAYVNAPIGISDGGGLIQVPYSLIDADEDRCNILPAFSLDGGLTWRGAAAGPGGDGLYDLETSPWPGISHTFVWNAPEDAHRIVRDNRRLIFRITSIPVAARVPLFQRVVSSLSIPFHVDIPPTFPEVFVNDDGAYTGSREVQLILSAVGALEMNISNSGYGLGVWEPFQQSRSWTLQAGTGVKSVYVQFRDNHATPHVVEALDTIILDESEPELGTGDIIILGIGTEGVEAAWTAWDDDSGIAENFYAVAGVTCDALGGLEPGDPGWDALSLTGPDWVSTGTNPHLELDYPLEEGAEHCLLVRVENGAGLATTARRELMVPVVGRVLLIAGGGDAYSNPELNTARILSDHVYTVLLDRGFDHEKIFYAAPYASTVDPELGNAVDLTIDGVADEQDLRDVAFYTWAASEVSGTVPFYLVMIDHGGPDKFLLDQFTSDPPEGSAYLEVEDTDGRDNDLRDWLDDLQYTTGCQVVVIYEACYSGSFVDPVGGTLSDPSRDRVLLASAGPDQKANFRYDGVVSFSQFFFDLAREGKSLYESFSQAAALLANYGFVDPQEPWLDDDGDGTYSEGSDGSVAAHLYLGIDPTPPPLAFVETSIDRQIEPPPPGSPVDLDVYGDLLNENPLSAGAVTATLVEPDGTAGAPVSMSGTDDGDPLTADRYETSFTFDDASPEGTYTVELNAEDSYGFRAVTRQVFIHVGAYQGDLYEENDAWGSAADAPLGKGPQVLNFHDDGQEDEDWLKFLAFEGFSYKLDTWTPGDPGCTGAQVNTDLGLYRIVGGSPELVSGATVGDHCPPSGPDYIEEWDCGETAEYYLKLVHGDHLSGPGSEYMLDMSITQGPEFKVKVKVFEGGTELKGAEAVVKVEAGVNSLGAPWSSLHSGYYKDGLSTLLSWTAKARKAGETTWKEVPVPAVGEGLTSSVTITIEEAGSTCAASAAAASPGSMTPVHRDPTGMVFCSVLYLLLVGLCRRVGRRRMHHSARGNTD